MSQKRLFVLPPSAYLIRQPWKSCEEKTSVLSSGWDERRRQSMMWVLGLAALVATSVLWSTAHLELKWIAAVTTGLFILGIAFASARLERFLYALLFFSIPVNVDFHFKTGSELARLYLVQGVPILGISAVDLLLCLLYPIWIFRLVTSPGAKQGIVWPAGASWFLAFLGWAALSTVNASHPALSWFLWIGFFKAFILFFYVVNNVRTKNDLALIATCLVAGLFVEDLIALAQQAVGGNLGLSVLGERKIEKELALEGEKVFRIGGTMSHPNFLGGYLISVLPVALAFTHSSKENLVKRMAGIGAFFMGFVVLVLTYSRSAWVMATFGCLVIFALIYAKRGSGASRKLLLPALLLTVVIGSLFTPLIKARMVDEDRGSTVSRVPQAKMAWSMIQSHPFLGVGLNQYTLIHHKYEIYAVDSLSWRRVAHVGAIHNIYLSLTAEVGLVGLFWLLGFMASTALAFFRNFHRTADPWTKLLLASLAAGFFLRIPHDAFHTGNLATHLVFWIYSACLQASRRGKELL